MRSLADRLAQVRPLGARPPAVRPMVVRDSFVHEDDNASRGAELERLRRSIEELVRTSAPGVRRTPVRLPFEPEENALGTCYVHRAELGLVERLGGIALEGALMVDASLLAMLALTPALASCNAERALYLDLETTGLGGGTGNVPFVVGMCFYDGTRHVLEQLLLREPENEAAMLERVRERMTEAELMVSFNGKAFDLTVLRARYVMNRLPPPPERPQLDLLHVARRVHRHRVWRKALTVVEREVLRHDRGPDVAGCEIAVRYQHFLRTGDESGLAAVVEHNKSDVLSMLALTALYGTPVEASGALWLPPEELASMARTMRRAGDLHGARRMADRAVARGAGAIALRARAEIAKALGDRQQALEDFEAVVAEASDPSVRLALAKLYEHHLKRPDLALLLVEQGTDEKPPMEARRRARLQRKERRKHSMKGDE